MKYGGRLTKQDASGPFAVCWGCQLVFRDDVPRPSVVVFCSKCYLPVERGIDRDRAVALLKETREETEAESTNLLPVVPVCIDGVPVEDVESWEITTDSEEGVVGEHLEQYPKRVMEKLDEEIMADVPTSLDQAAADADLGGAGDLDSVDPAVYQKMGFGL